MQQLTIIWCTDWESWKTNSSPRKFFKDIKFGKLCGEVIGRGAASTWGKAIYGDGNPHRVFFWSKLKLPYNSAH